MQKQKEKKGELKLLRGKEGKIVVIIPTAAQKKEGMP